MTSAAKRTFLRYTTLFFSWLTSVSVVVAQSGQEEVSTVGLEYDSAAALYQALHDEAKGGDRLEWDSLPDWGGVWSKTGGPGYDTNGPRGSTTAKMTRDAAARYAEAREAAAAGNNFDPLSLCAPSGHPRWFSSGYLREYIVTPDQTWLITETGGEVRRIYTDGRGHTSPDYAYPTVHGDSIGFWNDERLIAHTKHVSAGVYGRDMMEKSDEFESVEIWEMQDNGDITAHVWHYDPPILAEPWYVKHNYTPTDDQNGQIRINHWHCTANQNNQVFQTEDGSTEFIDLDFLDDD